MLRRALLLALAGALLLVTAGCAEGDSRSTLSVEGIVSICPASGDCADLPAAGATVTVLDSSGDEVDSGKVNSEGSWETEVPEGTYTATLSLAALDIATTAAQSTSVSIEEGGSGALTISLPAVHVVP